MSDDDATAAPAEAGYESDTAHPWRRWFARQIDFTLIGLAWTWALGPPAAVTGGLGQSFVETTLQGIVFTAVGCALVAASLARWGTTPGKRLLGVELRGAGGARLDARGALRRELHVFARALCAGIPIATLVTQAMAYAQVKAQGRTVYDTSLGSEVRFRRRNAGQWGLAIAVMLALVCAEMLLLLRAAGTVLLD